MCDYSLHSVATRPANVGDKLVTSKFPHTLTQGFSALDQPDVAVCVLPGTEIVFDKEVERRSAFLWLFPRLKFVKLGGRVARFRQIHMNNPQTHHDALEFANGRTVLLTDLCLGQCATVLQLPAPAHVGTETAKERRPVEVS